ncbi:MAG: O-antigen ligase domain-containing protein, partial [Isosphaeraceae bacterium]
MTLRLRLLRATDHLLAALVAGLLLGSALAFGGRVWWAPAVLAALCGFMTLTFLLRTLVEGRLTLLKSPLTFLACLALALGALQVAPLPAAVSGLASPNARAAYALGFLPDRPRRIDPSVELPEPPAIRSPVSVDRPATIRWVAGAAACLAVFVVISRFADRLGRLYLVWGCVVAAFFLNTSLAVVQLICGNSGLYGLINPGAGPLWAPDLNDLLASPNATRLRGLVEAQGGHPSWFSAVPDRPFAIGTQMGGAGAYLALGSLGLPLALGITLQLMAPRGSREPLGLRLSQAGQGGLLTLMILLSMTSALVVGLLAGPLLAAPFAVGLLAVGLPAARPTGLRWSAVGLTAFALVSLASGATLGKVWESSRTMPPPVAPVDLRIAATVWTDALAIFADFPLAGTGLGTFATIFPYYKSTDAGSTTAMSSLLQWSLEAGLLGLGVLGIALLWCLGRIPSAVKGVGAADRALVFGLIGAGLGFT